MKQVERTRKAKEAHAEFLLKVSASLFTAFFITIFVVPMSAVVGAAFNAKPEIGAIEVYKNLFGSWYGAVFLVAELCLYKIVLLTKDRGLDIYDDLYPDECDKT